jgi:hypothetical protein
MKEATLLALLAIASGCASVPARTEVQAMRGDSDAALVTLMKSVVFYQAATYNDADSDGVGEYPSLAQLSGKEASRNGTQSLSVRIQVFSDQMDLSQSQVVEQGGAHTEIARWGSASIVSVVPSDPNRAERQAVYGVIPAAEGSTAQYVAVRVIIVRNGSVSEPNFVVAERGKVAERLVKLIQ